MKILLINIKELLQVREPSINKVCGVDMKHLPSIENAWLLIENESVSNFGKMEDLPNIQASETIDCTGKLALRYAVW